VRALWLVVTLALVLGNCFFVEQVQSWRGGASPSAGDQTAGTWRAVVASPIALFTHFLVGFLAADFLLSAHWAGRSTLVPAVARPRPNAFDAIACLCLLLIFTLDIERWVPGAAAAATLLHLTYDFPIFHLLVAALLVTASLSGFVGRALDNRFLRATATLSFGIYLWHFFLILALGRIDDSLLRPATVGAALVTFTIVLSMSFATAAASYFLLERPVLLRTHLYKPSPTKVPLQIGREPPESA
jgi:peptidoglycan/LPS O-acetylase OafA/YrhL